MRSKDVTLLVHKRPDDQWGWLLRMGDNVIARSGEPGYANITDCTEIADAVVSGFFADAERRQEGQAAAGEPGGAALGPGRA